MPNGQCPKIKGAICNVLINADDICKVLQLFEAIRPKVVHGVLDFLKKNNALYYDIDISIDNILKDEYERN